MVAWKRGGVGIRGTGCVDIEASCCWLEQVLRASKDLVFPINDICLHMPNISTLHML
jgi:hypothetical protein